VSWILGWETITGAGWWSGFYFWASIVALILLGITEIASHRYTERKEFLVAQEQDAKDKQHDEEMARLHLETAKITEKAAQLEKEAADSQLKLATLRTPRARLLTDNVLDSIADKLTPFKGTKFDTGLSVSSGEQADFLWRLETALTQVELYPNEARRKNAGWIELAWGFDRIGVGATAVFRGKRPVSGPVAAQNVEIHLHPSFRDALLPAATALASALMDAGIAAQIAGYNTHNSSDEAIHILIGEKQ